jgi:hypothetical protein
MSNPEKKPPVKVFSTKAFTTSTVPPSFYTPSVFRSAP